ncbi:RluA family pseudouridine synthase [Acetoanaerobium noterae]|uniref:RluA family pseudouridine synthase n=1 Tax=Acetoanaerobium noterae TaxID=745369 RepID=UPI0028AFF2D0|nr:RluA family pseudouridine synthase [Acetoanaerobium noterae]
MGEIKVTPEVIYEDNHIIVVVKPFGMPSQEDDSKDLDMLSWVKAYVKEKYNKPGEVFIGLVHRLDRVSGGLMVFARTSKAAARLSDQIRKKQIEKKYTLVAEGSLEKKSGFMEDFLVKDKLNNKVKAFKNEVKDSKDAKLSYEVMDERQGLSLVSVDLITGRSHQIRVQFSSRGCPLYGDLKYGSSNPQKKSIALWSNYLSFEHPTKKEKLEFKIELPDHKPWDVFK